MKNKLLMITLVSVIAGTLAITSTASAEGINNTMSQNGKSSLSEKFNKFWSEKNEKSDDNNKNKSRKNATSTPQTEAEKITKTNTRIQALANVSVANKATIATNIQTQIATLTALKIKINSDTSLSVLKADIKLITKYKESFGLGLFKNNPFGDFHSTFVKLNTLASTTSALNVDIQTAKAKGLDVTGIQTMLANANAKIVNANLQSNSALSMMATLLPNMGSSTVRTANKQIMVDAHTKYKLALSDIKDAKTYIKKIVRQLKEWNVVVTSTTNQK